MKILVADDEFPIREFLADVLELGGHAVVTVENGRQLLDQLVVETFDLVITDNAMPVMTGLAALQQIRANGEKDLAVVVFTADSIKCEAVALGAIYLPKPAKVEEILAAVAAAAAPRA